MSKRIRQKGGTFVFLGISGSGKGTQAALLMKALPKSVNVSTGDGLRRIRRKNNLVGRYVRGILDRGLLMPWWAPTYLWLSAFIEKLAGDENLIFDGAPRRIEEARAMDSFMRDIGRPLPVAIYIRLLRREAEHRLLKRGRHDDNRRAIAGRFRFFETNVRPVINYYRRKKRLIAVNGDQEVLAVWRDIKRALNLK